MPGIAIANVGDLAVGDMKAVNVDGKKILLYHLEDGFYATQASCTHIFASLARGKIVEGCQVQCPLHRARFDIRTGEVVEWANFPPGIQLVNALRKEKALTTYPVKVEGDSLLAELK